MDDAAKARLRQEAVLGEKISGLLKDEDVNGCLQAMREELRTAMENEFDREKRDLIWLELNGLRTFLQSVNRVIETGHMAVKSLQDEAKREESRQVRR
jgi:hypothetical protein